MITLKKTREELQKELGEANIKLGQYQHQIQRLENRIRDQQDSARKKRNHRLITRGADVENMAPEVRGMSQAAFCALVERHDFFNLPVDKAFLFWYTDITEVRIS